MGVEHAANEVRGELLPSTYEPARTERRWYEFWLANHCFPAEVDRSREPYCIVIPPPNVTGALHIGHALDNTLQDILIRWHRMAGYAALWVPGTDHASIATQLVVTKRLAEQGIDRLDLGREKFLERAWQWKDEYERAILGQLQRLGCSCDWSRTRFTMDELLSRATLESFVRYFREGLVYRGDYIVNWCPECGTAISDIEVEHEDTAGHLYHILYPYSTGDGASSSGDGTGSQGAGAPGPGGRPAGVVVATTRPETMLGDTAVAVHPDDERYKAAVGRTVILPLMEREIPIVADAYADPAFGTGAVKVTPAHDPNDFEIGRRHGLPRIKVIGENARMTAEAGAYAGMDRYECREAVVRDLDARGLLVKVEDHPHAVGHCHRCESVVEPLVSKQWFVRMKPLAERAIEAVTSGEVRFVPERFAKIYLNWMENVQDWCISRQLWWGHRIPVWYCDECGEVIASVEEPAACARCGTGRSGLRQDEDVLDTWFSSALWPFSTLGWPEKTTDLDFFFPTSVLVTGYDIIFFWVARMVFSSYHFMKERPFDFVLIHGLVRAADGRKMSKSLGTGVDPIDAIDKYGADALRFMLVHGNAPGNDMRFNWDKIEAARNFANKLWNASRFVLMNLGDDRPALEGLDRPDIEATILKEGEPADRWIVSRYRGVSAEVDRLLEAFDLGEVARTLYDFIWSELCDWYIEMVKPRLYGEHAPSRRLARLTLVFVLEGVLRLLHPYMPFITEEIWQKLPALGGEHPTTAGRHTPGGAAPGAGDEQGAKDQRPRPSPNPPPDKGERPRTIVLAPWPAPSADLRDEALEEDMDVVLEVIRSIRNLRAEMNVPAGKRAPATLVASADKTSSALAKGLAFIKDLAYVSDLVVERELAARPKDAAAAVTRGVEIFLPLRGLIDVEKEAERLAAELAGATKDLDRVRTKLANAEFVAKAPESVVGKERAKAEELELKCSKLSERLALLRDAAGR
ncbi:MAG: valine--tRNA ligase [Bacillota bacterium]|nr:MAG: valine--tRNA ligase [Bacillota bacterium]